MKDWRDVTIRILSEKIDMLEAAVAAQSKEIECLRNRNSELVRGAPNRQTEGLYVL